MATASDVPLLQGADDPKRITISMGSAGDACGVWDLAVCPRTGSTLVCDERLK